MGLKASVHELNGFSEEQKEKYIKASNLMCDIFNSKEFEQRVLNYFWTFDDQTITGFKNPVSEGKHYSQSEIIDYIRSGCDLFNKERDEDIDLAVTLYNDRFGNTIGYTVPYSFHSWINLKFFGQYAVGDIAGNIAHEYMHNLGFTHSQDYNETRKHTVPYAIGTIVRQIAQEYDNPQPSDKKDGKFIYERRYERSWKTLFMKKYYWEKVYLN